MKNIEDIKDIFMSYNVRLSDGIILAHSNITSFLHFDQSIDWFQGKITGKSYISWENLWFPVGFPLSQPIESADSSVFQTTPQKPQENGGDGEDESDLKQCVCNLIVAQKDGPSDKTKSTVMLSSNAQIVPECCMLSSLVFCE